MRRYAQGTNVGVSRSREQINRLLEDWGAQNIQWTDGFAPKRQCMLRFGWVYEEVNLTARFLLVCDMKKIEEDSIDGRSGGVSETKMEKSLAAWGGEAHRLLLLFLKGAMYSIDAGLIRAEQIFMPFFEDKDGNVVGELLIERLKDLPRLSTMKMLTSGTKEKEGSTTR